MHRLVLALPALLIAAPAAANMAAVQIRPATLAGPRFAAGTQLRVEGERLTLRCEERAGGATCAFEATYRIVNPGDAPAAVAGAFYGRKEMTRDVAIRAAGRDLAATLEPELVAALDASVGVGDERRGEAAIRHRIAPDRDAARWGFRLEVAAGERVEVTATGLLRGGRRFVPSSYVFPAVAARHVFAPASTEPRIDDFEYWLSPLATWSGEPSVEIELRFPAGWSLDPEGWELSSDGEERIARRRARPTDGELRFALVLPAPRLFRGGPVLAVGGTTGDGHGLRVRGGWEAACAPWLLGSVVAEWGWKDRLVVAPVLKAASPWAIFIPSLGVGVGVPIQLLPERRAGVRLELDAMLGPIGFVASLDWYAGSPRRFEQTWAFAVAF